LGGAGGGGGGGAGLGGSGGGAGFSQGVSLRASNDLSLTIFECTSRSSISLQ
jgi:hypothetical protein